MRRVEQRLIPLPRGASERMISLHGKMNGPRPYVSVLLIFHFIISFQPTLSNSNLEVKIMTQIHSANWKIKMKFFEIWFIEVGENEGTSIHSESRWTKTPRFGLFFTSRIPCISPWLSPPTCHSLYSSTKSENGCQRNEELLSIDIRFKVRVLENLLEIRRIFSIQLRRE